jgi:nucleoside-diphosphate-sugar epimerase
MHIVILGCGFTGRRVAEKFIARGARVTVTTRDPQKLADLNAEVVTLQNLRITPGVQILYSIPPDPAVHINQILGNHPARVVYLSTTGVYGPAHHVDETTLPDPTDPRAISRLRDEAAIAAGPWSSLILRPAAIYGPGRGAQESVRRGVYVSGDNYISRIHVDDLATHAEAALLSELTGAFPVADEESCTTREMADFCARLLNVQLSAPAEPSRTLTANRRVDGSAIRRLLGVTLKYPSYRTGIPASL